MILALLQALLIAFLAVAIPFCLILGIFLSIAYIFDYCLYIRRK